MGRSRFSVVGLMTVLAVIGLNLGVFRSLARVTGPGSNQKLYLVPIDATHVLPFATLALGVLPMSSVLVPATIFQAIAARRSGAVGARGFGFVAGGWLAVFAFMALASLSPSAVQSAMLGIGERIGPPILAALGDHPADGLVDGIEWVFCLVFFALPELAIALAGAWLLGRSGGRVAVEAGPESRGAGLPLRVAGP